MRFHSLVAVTIVVSLTVVSLVGCGSPDAGQPQSIASEERVQQIVEMRKYYDKAGGQWDSLSAEDKAAFTKIAGDDAKAQAMWRTMSTPLGANPSGS